MEQLDQKKPLDLTGSEGNKPITKTKIIIPTAMEKVSIQKTVQPVEVIPYNEWIAYIKQELLNLQRPKAE